MNNDLLDMGLHGLGLLLLAAWRAVPLLAIALLVDVIFARRIAPKCQALLWTLVVVRLLLPISLPSSWSLHGPLDRLVANRSDDPTAQAEPSPGIHQPRNLSMRIGDESVAPLINSLNPETPRKHGVDWQDVLLTTLVVVGALVAGGSLLRSSLAHLRFTIRLRGCRELNDRHLIDVVLRECDDLHVRRRPQLKEVPELTAPAVFGLLRVTICLPANILEALSEQEFRWVLRHELAHVCRRDTWLLSLASGMRSLHWFDPLAWLAASRLRSHVEAAADDLALGTSSSSDVIAYGRLLLRFAEQASSPNMSPALGLLPFLSGRRLRGRIEKLTQHRTPRQHWSQWTVGFATLVLAAVGLTDASERSALQGPAIHLPALDVAVLNSQAPDTGPLLLRTYDVTEVLERIRELEPEGDAEQILMRASRAVASGRGMRIEGGRLIAEVAASQHEALTWMLDAWRLGGPQQIVVELRIMNADLSFTSSINWVAARIGNLEQHGPGPVIAARITEDQLRQVVRSLLGDRRGNIMMAPKVTVFNGQSATIADVAQRPFVTNVEPQEDGSLKPMVEVFESGLKVMLRPVTTGNGTVELTFDLQVLGIDQVAMANLPFRHTMGPHSNITVQVPIVSTTSVRSTVRLPATESVLIAAPRLFDDKSSDDSSTEAIFYALTPRLLANTHVSSDAAVSQGVSKTRQQ